MLKSTGLAESRDSLETQEKILSALLQKGSVELGEDVAVEDLPCLGLLLGSIHAERYVKDMQSIDENRTGLYIIQALE